jgi:hypothetical protein
MTVTVELAVNLGTGEANRPLLVTSNQLIPVKKHTELNSSHILCMQETQIYSVVFCVTRTVHKIDCRLIQ